VHRAKLIAWFGVPLVLAAAGTFWLTRGPEARRPRERPRSEHSNVEAAGDSQSRQVLSLTRERGRDVGHELATLYGSWAGDERALDARKLALGALFAEPSLGLKLHRVLEAVEADPTPPEDDPLWPHVVNNLADLWTSATFDKGRDLMLMEQRSRPRRAIVASFARLSDRENIGRLNEDQRLLLSNDFVDIYGATDPAQKPELLTAVRRLAGNDVADILSGRALEPGFKLQAALDYDHAVQEATRTPMTRENLPLDESALDREP